MGARPIGKGTGLHIPGLYQGVRDKELRRALSPDPRLLLGDLPPHEREVLEAQTYSPTTLGQVDELMEWKPVKVPRWLLGGRITCPEARGWEPYESRRYDWFVVSPDDTLVPTDPPDLYRD